MCACSRTLILLLALASAGCSSESTRQPVSTEGDETAIREMASAYSAAVAAGDTGKFYSFYTDDVTIMPPDLPAVRGADAFRAFANPFFDQYSMQETISYDGISVFGDQAIGTYAYTFTTTPKAGGGPASEEKGKGMVVLTRSADRSWKWSQVIWNRDAPPTPAPGTP